MSNELIQAADDARRLLRGFAAIETVAAAFENVGQLEQRKDEVEKLLKKLGEDVKEATDTFRTTVEKAELANAEAKRMTADAKTVADGIVSSAEAKAKALVEDAMAAVREADQAKSNTIASAEAHLGEIEVQRNVLLAEVEALEARAAEAKAYLAKLSG